MRGFFSIGFGRVMNLGLGMLSLMLVVRHISAEAYGAYILARVISTFLGEVSSFGLTLVIPKYVASAPDVRHQNRLINTVIYFRIFTVILLSSLILAVRPALAALFGASSLLPSLFLYIPILFGLYSLARTLSSILQGLFRFKMLGIASSVSAIVNFIATIVFVFPLNLGTIGLIYAAIVSNSVMIMLVYSGAHIKDRRAINLPILKEMLLFGLPLQMQYMLDFVYSRIDTLVIGSFLGTSSIAFYEIARKLPTTLMSLYDVFRSVYYPFIATFHDHGELEQVARVQNNSHRVLSFLTSLAALMAVLFGREIITTLYSDSYIPSYYAFVILMFGLNLTVLDNTLGFSLIAIGHPGKPLIVNIVRTTISLSLNVVVTPIYSFVGAAVVSVVSNFIAVPLDVYFLSKTKVHVESALFLKPIVICGVYSLLFLLLGSSLLPIKILFVFLFMLTCLMMSVIAREDWRVILAEARTVRNRLSRKEAVVSEA